MNENCEVTPQADMVNRLVALEGQLRVLRHQLISDRPAFQFSEDVINLLCLKIDSQQYALYLPVVSEIIRMVKLSPLSGAPAAISGLLNLHGTIIPVLDLRLLLGNSPQREN